MKTSRTFKESRRLFEAIFGEHADAVYRLCLYKTSSQTVAEDLTQETFLRLWKSISAGALIDKPKSYVYQIARNLIIDHYKSNKSLSLDSLQEDGFDVPSNDLDPVLLSDLSLLREMIETLDPDYREITYLRFVEGYRVKEIAEMFDISENLAAVRINRAINKLREKFT